MKRIVSYSLWNQNNPFDPYQSYKCRPIVYNAGAIENTKLIKRLYPGWIARFYVDDTVPPDIIDSLNQLGAEIFNMEGSRVPPMMWRFLACGDINVDCMVSRDADSRIYQREVDAVNEWLNSDKTLHVMRDHPGENFKILGGMWGWKNSNFLYTGVQNDILTFMENKKFRRMHDMEFLYPLWDKMKGHTMAHDSLFSYPDSTPFPNDKYHKKKEYHEHVGECIDEHNNRINLDRDTRLYENMDFNHLNRETETRLQI